MHVLLLTYEFHPTNGGVANSTLALGRALRAHCGDSITVVVCQSWWPWEERIPREKWDGFDIHRIPYTGLPEVRRFRQSIRSLICFLQLFIRIRSVFPDVILAQRVHDLGWFAGLIGRVLGIPTFAYAHGPDEIQHAELHPVRTRLNVWSLALNRCVFVTNEYFRRFFLRLDSTASVDIVPNIVPEIAIDSGTQDRHSATDGRFHIACVGRMVVEHGVETKGFSHAIRAMAELPDTVMHFFGEGPLQPELACIAEETGQSERVLFHGRQDRIRLHHELHRMDLLLHPALIEGLPMIIIEAMALGVPVMATDVGGIPDLVRNGETGILIRAGDSADIVRAVRSVLGQPTLLEAYASRAREHVMAHASPGRVARLVHGHFLRHMNS